MARTLVINNADFSVNKLETVTLGGKPCTGISLDKDTASITSINGTTTLIATVTPADTTDAVVWSTSDADVATVSGGIITAVGCGSATITATCGSFSDTCTVTVTHIATFARAIDTYIGKDDNKDYLTGGTLENRGIGYLETGTLKICGSSGFSGKYPITIPKGANKIEFTGCSTFKPIVFWLSSVNHSTAQSSVALAYAKDSAGTYPTDAGNRTITIPDRTAGTYVGVDAIAVCVSCTTTITAELLNTVVMTFTA